MMKVTGEYGYVYIGDAGNRIKVACTLTPRKRIRQVENAARLRFTRVFVTTPTTLYQWLEWIIKQYLAVNRIRGEWFSVPFNAAVEDLRKVADMYLRLPSLGGCVLNADPLRI